MTATGGSDLEAMLQGDYPMERDLPAHEAAYLWYLLRPEGAEAQPNAPAGYSIYHAANGCEVRIFQGWLGTDAHASDAEATETMRVQLQQIYVGQLVADFKELEPLVFRAGDGSASVTLQGMNAAYEDGAPWSARMYYRAFAGTGSGVFASMACEQSTWDRDGEADRFIEETIAAIRLIPGEPSN